ncbi:GNAT family N-acetyltransferase [Micromonospora sp. NPDC049903]|uniref:GNAT family N-acetyltransferase n=1 Tax=Micromonospora sp. NPDC049903 TaxID=3364276 RepID=UPI0037AC5053
MTDPHHHQRHVPGFGTVTFRPVDPEADADVIHGWVSQDRARFWGMRDADRDRVVEVYRYVDSLPSHHAYLTLRDGQPVALFQGYQPEHDPVGECYPVRPGDYGGHLLIGTPVRPEPGFTGTLLAEFVAFVFTDPAQQRLIMEPDARNDKAIARLRRAGFVEGPLIDLPHKQARLMFLDRPDDQPGPDGRRI